MKHTEKEYEALEYLLKTQNKAVERLEQALDRCIKRRLTDMFITVIITAGVVTLIYTALDRIFI